MVKNRDVILDTTKRYLTELRQHGINITAAYLFGSYASGAAREDSDIDIAIISENFSTDKLEDMVRLKLLTEAVDLDISPHPYLPIEVDRAQKGTFIHDEIIEKGILISL